MRQATIEDAPRILEMLMDYYLERKPKNVDFNVTKTRAVLQAALSHSDCICFFDPDGFIMAAVTPGWFCDATAANGVAWYVKPEVRRGPLPVKLWRAYLKDAKKRGAKYARFEFDNSVHLRKGHTNLYMREI